MSRASDAAAESGGSQPDELLCEQYRCIVNRIKSDIRFFFNSLEEFVNLSPELSNSGDWESFKKACERDIKEVADAAGKQDAVLSIEPVVSLLNCRDQIMMCLIDGILYQKAVLDSDLQRQREGGASGRMAEMHQLVQALSQKSDRLPDLYPLSSLPYGSLPSAMEPGPFTYDKKKQSDSGSWETTVFPVRLLGLFSELTLLDTDLRWMKFGSKVTIQDKHKPQGKVVGTGEIRTEISKLFDKCARLENELQTSKAQRHTPWDQRIEQLNAKISEKEIEAKKQVNRMHKLEGEVMGLKTELANVQRELQELNDKNQKMMAENLPRIEEIDLLLHSTWEANDRLTADAEMLSSMFKLQADDHKAVVKARDTVSAELTKVQRLLKGERLKKSFKEDELQKKETLYQRTVVARKEIHDSYTNQKETIQEVQERLKQQEQQWGELVEVAEARTSSISQLKEDLAQANQDIDLLEQQKKAYSREFKSATGRPCSMLLEQFKVEPGKPATKGGAK